MTAPDPVPSPSVPGADGAPSLRRVVAAAGDLLADAGVPSAHHDAAALAAFVLGVPRFEPALAGLEPAGFRARYAEVVERRRRREPLQHIVGEAGFRHVVLAVEPGVFVPRPETESVAQRAVDEAAAVAASGRPPLVVDLCCGAGGIAVSVAFEVPAARVVAVDLSAQAVALTGRNADRAGVRPERLVVADATADDVLADLEGAVDVVVANPPYIPPDAVPLDAEVRDHDPDLALYGGGADGLLVPRGVVRTAARLLRTGGLLVMEHAEVQASAARAMADGAFEDITTGTDLTGRDRMLLARRSGRAVVRDSPS
ncbi:peptide chain release factor N(5)-glutamine methyltransferase [Actinotalea sp. Marseille-Q4924]|uniref:peptide chain release factor N(5)-glutamine methyltransferase n=1 Tax=Actinotalea sp. Marseille-Q4924 TaxID=2866571 RepID=UPI001CE3BDD0|nr:peptide chain release factor N(5)-glutamine methyltransferase [Actinotalea sp. Marseille-Q4924]